MTAPDQLKLLQQIAAALSEHAPVDIGTMFNSPGIRLGTNIVVFLGRDDRLIAKVPRERALELIEAGTAGPVTMGKRTMREWIALSAAATPEETLAAWLPISIEALEYIQRIAEDGEPRR
jgi:hypothetical protein